MHHPDLRHHARDRIVAAEVIKLDLHEAELRAARGEPGVLETRKPRRAVRGPAKLGLACASRRSPTEADSARTSGANEGGRQAPGGTSAGRCGAVSVSLRK